MIRIGLTTLCLWISTTSAFGDEASRADQKNDSKPPTTTAPTEVPDAIQELQSKVVNDMQSKLKALQSISDSDPQAETKYSSRGDAQMFLGEFSQAVSDYEAMVRVEPATDPSHWRLGIAYFFAGKYEQAAGQFDKYHSFDNVDRENGIWRFLSHYRASGAEKARQELLKYEKDDRPPFPEVYRLFDGSLTPEQVLAAIPEDLPLNEKQSACSILIFTSACCRSWKANAMLPGNHWKRRSTTLGPSEPVTDRTICGMWQDSSTTNC